MDTGFGFGGTAHVKWIGSPWLSCCIYQCFWPRLSGTHGRKVANDLGSESAKKPSFLSAVHNDSGL